AGRVPDVARARGHSPGTTRPRGARRRGPLGPAVGRDRRRGAGGTRRRHPPGGGADPGGLDTTEEREDPGQPGGGDAVVERGAGQAGATAGGATRGLGDRVLRAADGWCGGRGERPGRGVPRGGGQEVGGGVAGGGRERDPRRPAPLR